MLRRCSRCPWPSRAPHGWPAAQSEAQYRAVLIEKLKFTIKKLRHDRFGQSTERGVLLDQLELAIGRSGSRRRAGRGGGTDGGSRGREDQCAVVRTAKPARRPLPVHLARERIVYPTPAAARAAAAATLRKIGEDVTETLELIPRQWKVIQHVREKFSCRACEAITQPPAPSHPIARGRAGPSSSATSCSPNTACICH